MNLRHGKSRLKMFFLSSSEPRKRALLGHRKGLGIAFHPNVLEWVHWWVVCCAGKYVVCAGGSVWCFVL